jgi:hypothetical protein
MPEIEVSTLDLIEDTPHEREHKLNMDPSCLLTLSKLGSLWLENGGRHWKRHGLLESVGGFPPPRNLDAVLCDANHDLVKLWVIYSSLTAATFLCLLLLTLTGKGAADMLSVVPALFAHVPECLSGLLTKNGSLAWLECVPLRLAVFLGSSCQQPMSFSQ